MLGDPFGNIIAAACFQLSLCKLSSLGAEKIKEIIELPNIHLEHIGTDLQAGDIFTKELPPLKWANALALLGMDTSLSDKYVFETFHKKGKSGKVSGAVAMSLAGPVGLASTGDGDTGCFVPLESADPDGSAETLRANSTPEQDKALREKLGDGPLDSGLYGACNIIDDVVSSCWDDYYHADLVRRVLKVEHILAGEIVDVNVFWTIAFH